jgi:hydroxymethylpyrimidine pyrophosphatase-like HAD family hydrolase
VVAASDGGIANVQRIPVELVDPICRLADEGRAIPCLLETDGRNESVFVPACTDAFTDWTVNDACYFKAHNVVRGRSPTLDEQTRIVRVVLCTTVDTAQQLHRNIKNRLSGLAITSVWSRGQPGRAWLEIGAANATKAYGVSHIASLLKSPLSDVVYYGDATTVLGPMAIVGEAAAVANAEDDVLAAADRIIGSAASGAVAFDHLERLGLGGNMCDC